jgi:hypothetical protein
LIFGARVKLMMLVRNVLSAALIAMVGVRALLAYSPVVRYLPAYILRALGWFYGSYLPEVFEEMECACHTLIRGLPLYMHIGFGVQCPEEVQVALQVLPLIEADLPEITRIIESRPDTSEGICAAVVVEAWKFFGEAEPPSDALYEACRAYWTACGRGQTTRQRQPTTCPATSADSRMALPHNIIGGRIVDLSHDALDVGAMRTPYLHEPEFFEIPEQIASLARCVPRIDGWVAEFLKEHESAKSAAIATTDFWTHARSSFPN